MIKKINRPKHLYIHIPFCKNICHYCDFVRFVTNKKTQQKYIKKIILELNELPKNYFKTIYIGGGTPNCLDNILLSLLLKTCKKLLEKKYEFTIECNPEFVDQKQVNIFNTYNINRISIGAQTTNNLILKKYNRKHSFDDVVNAIKILRLNNIDNINLDFIYGFNELKKTDIVNVIKFVKKNKIPHVSFYALELKENSFISKNKIFLSDEKIDDELKLIVSLFKKNNYHRYEVSSWVLNKKYESLHNKAYWETKEWIGIGLGASGFENNELYTNKGDISTWKKEIKHLSEKELYLQIMMMGLRLTKGINLLKSINKKAFLFFKEKLDKKKIKNYKNTLIANNVNTLDEILLELMQD